MISALIILALGIGILGVYTVNRANNRANSNFEDEVQSSGEPRWGLLIASLIPGFFLGAIMAGFYEGMGIIDNSEAFSPSFFVFVSIGFVISYFSLDRILKHFKK